MTWLATVRPAMPSEATTGLAIAMPVGAVGTMLVTLATRSGFRASAAAVFGVASADGGYALAAALSGMSLREGPVSLIPALKLLSAMVLMGVGAQMLTCAFTAHAEGAPNRDRRDLQPRYFAFLGLTLVNPLTRVYFCSVVVQREQRTEVAVALDPAGGRFSIGAVFAISALLASAAWRLCLVAAGLRLRWLTASLRGRMLSYLTAAGFVLTLVLRSVIA
ncbi:threonine/homoserine/homoserine lactone efflux protein [Kribbella sp. VKM Ac-2571]|uniref:LysE family transporter n=1 Tax=Kribbella sp. VKM Ac-2571 TaxID=2512222 RepID=UPI00105FC858|nr:LysE family transporter [Kribbella sp. VKM Ac-2571]TDO56660.1 threonine/homoserine/homoserine lactone efflux protein [Kribbella sp. VKM Ac-2571]